MVDLGIDEQDRADGRVTNGSGWLQGGKGFNLGADVGRRVEKHPLGTVGADRDRRLGPGGCPDSSGAKANTVVAVAVPLWETAAGART